MNRIDKGARLLKIMQIVAVAAVVIGWGVGACFAIRGYVADAQFQDAY